MAHIIDGKLLAQKIRFNLKQKIEALKSQNRSVGLAVILVGENPASQVYVRNKINACHEIGIERAHTTHYPKTPLNQISSPSSKSSMWILASTAF